MVLSSFVILIFLSWPAAYAGESPLLLQKVVKEAEDFSLAKARLSASNVLWKNIKKFNKEEGKTIREKIFQLSRYFYTDKGFQAYLEGREHFKKQKFSDAVEKLMEADELEMGNADVLHWLALAQLWSGKTNQAEAINKRALQVCPVDLELYRDALAIQVKQEKWVDALSTVETASKDFNDTSAQTLKNGGGGFFKVESSLRGAKKFRTSLAER